jgi:hypothetical protein
VAVLYATHGMSPTMECLYATHGMSPLAMSPDDCKAMRAGKSAVLFQVAGAAGCHEKRLSMVTKVLANSTGVGDRLASGLQWEVLQWCVIACKRMSRLR